MSSSSSPSSSPSSSASSRLRQAFHYEPAVSGLAACARRKSCVRKCAFGCDRVAQRTLFFSAQRAYEHIERIHTHTFKRLQGAALLCPSHRPLLFSSLFLSLSLSLSLSLHDGPTVEDVRAVKEGSLFSIFFSFSFPLSLSLSLRFGLCVGWLDWLAY